MRYATVLSAVVLAALPCFAQIETQPATVNQPQQPTSTLRARAHLVIVDVVVEDKSHNAVRGLKASDFSLLEDKSLQQIRNFEEHFPASSGDGTQATFTSRLPPGMFTNYTAVPSNSAINILLIDMLNTPVRDQPYLHDQLLKFARSQPEGYPTAVFGLSGGLYMLQGVTTDPKVLAATLLRKNMPGKSPMLDDTLRGGPDSQIRDLIVQNPDSDGPGISRTLAAIQAFDKSVNVERTEARASMTLDALNSLARYLAGMPGRKNLIWFAGGFPINATTTPASLNAAASTVGPITTDASDGRSGFSNFAGTAEQIHDTTNLLTRSQVAVYPIDARGLFTFNGMDAERAGTEYARSLQARPGAPGSTTYAGSDILDFSINVDAEHDVMSTIARETGGRAYFNANNLSRFASTAMQNGSRYYTLTYTPTNRKWNNRFRAIQVEMAVKGYNLSYRRGYYAQDPDSPSDSTREASQKNAALAPAPINPAAAAMLPGSPTPTEIMISARIHPASATTETVLAADNILDDPSHAIAYRRYIVETIADARNLQSTKLPDGRSHLSVEFVTFVYAPSGKRINRVTTTLVANLTPENYTLVLRKGLAIRQELSVPAKGDTSVRIGVHDRTSNRIGVIEVGTAELANVPIASPVSAGTQ